MPYPPIGLPGCPTQTTGHRQAFADGFTMAFQPIYNITTGSIFAHEALVRSLRGGGAADVMRRLSCDTHGSFDRKCRIKAIAMAKALGLTSKLSVNCMADAVVDPDNFIRTTLIVADHYGFDIKNLILEFSETDYLRDAQHLRTISARFRKRGFMTAIDDFGTGFSGLGALCDMQTDLIKIDMTLVRGIETDDRRQRIVRSIVGMCRELGTTIIVKGVESSPEFDFLRGLGITHFQGFFLGRPLLEGLRTAPLIRLPVAA